MKFTPFHHVAAVVAALVLLVFSVPVRATTGLPCRYEIDEILIGPNCPILDLPQSWGMASVPMDDTFAVCKAIAAAA